MNHIVSAKSEEIAELLTRILHTLPDITAEPLPADDPLSALMDGSADFAVLSAEELPCNTVQLPAQPIDMRDLYTGTPPAAPDLSDILPPELKLAAVLPRVESHSLMLSRRDALNFKFYGSKAELCSSADFLVGESSSLRREEILKKFPQVRFTDAPDDTAERVKLLKTGTFDAIFIPRTAYTQFVHERFSFWDDLNTPLAVEESTLFGLYAVICRKKDKLAGIARRVNHNASRKEFEAEYYLKQCMGGIPADCRSHVGSRNIYMRAEIQTGENKQWGISTDAPNANRTLLAAYIAQEILKKCKH